MAVVEVMAVRQLRCVLLVAVGDKEETRPFFRQTAVQDKLDVFIAQELVLYILQAEQVKLVVVVHCTVEFIADHLVVVDVVDEVVTVVEAVLELRQVLVAVVVEVEAAVEVDVVVLLHLLMDLVRLFLAQQVVPLVHSVDILRVRVAVPLVALKLVAVENLDVLLQQVLQVVVAS
jgi:hypothetical protein